MSGIVVFADGGLGFMLSDTASYGEAGVFESHTSKVFTHPHATMVSAGRGSVTGCLWAAEIVGRFASFDDFEANGPAVLKAEFDKDFGGMDLTVMGWSETGASVHACLANSRDFASLVCGPLLAAPMLTPQDLAGTGLLASNGQLAFSHENAPAAILAIMEAQRRAIAATEPGHMIGGAAVLTVVGKNRIVQVVVHRWPDKVGERIRV